MMSAITGKLGGGKTLFAVHLIQEALRAGRPVATNIDFKPECLLPARKRAVIFRLPDHPGADSLEIIGQGNSSYDERRNGLIVLDECSHFLSARSWNARGRDSFIRFLTQSRKLGWDVYLLVQGVDMIDSQVRDNLLETTVRLRNLSRQMVPFVGRWLRSLGLPHYLPRFHLAQARYGTDPSAPVAETWSFRGADLIHAYDTRQLFGEVDSNSCVLDPWTVKGRYLPNRRPWWHWPVLLAWWGCDRFWRVASLAWSQSSLNKQSAQPGFEPR